jgi:hypothetical protein
LVIKTDSDGNVLWQQTFGGAGTEYGYNGLTTSDGYLVIGYTTSLGAGSKDIYLIKMDLEGKKIWEKTYGGKSWDVGTALCATKDGNYMVCGFTHSMGNGEEDIYVLKIDRNGKKIWSKTYGGKRIEMGNSISAAADGGFLIGATSGSVSQNTDFYLLKINSTGGQVWEKNYVAKGPAGHGFDWCSMITRTRDGGAILTGYSDCDPVMDICTIKVDSAGNECWQNIMSDNPFYDYGNAVCETANNEFLVAGTTKFMLRNQKLHNNDFFYALMDANGAIKWEKTIPADGNDWCNAATVTKDGGILLLGQTDSGGKGGFDVCLIKVRE